MRNDTRNRPTAAEQATVGQDRAAGCLLRLFWMAFGNLALLMLALVIFQRGGFSLLDGVYWAVVVAPAGARYTDIGRFGGLTTSGEPATMRHFRRYVIGLVLLAAGCWASVHVLSVLR